MTRRSHGTLLSLPVAEQCEKFCNGTVREQQYDYLRHDERFCRRLSKQTYRVGIGAVVKHGHLTKYVHKVTWDGVQGWDKKFFKINIKENTYTLICHSLVVYQWERLASFILLRLQSWWEKENSCFNNIHSLSILVPRRSQIGTFLTY